jgi:hypothetical protein
MGNGVQAKRNWVPVAVGLVALVIPGSASAAVTFGSNLSQPAGVGHQVTGTDATEAIAALPATSLAPGGQTSPSDGVIVRWRIKMGDPTTAVRLRVIRPGNSTTATGAGTGESVTPPANTTSEFATRLPIQAGDGIGVNFGDGETLTARSETTGANTHAWFPALQDNGPPDDGSVFSSRELLINADVEPDCDSDALGDETQDPELSPIPACDPNPPEATITGGPKNVVKTKKKRAKVTFTFTSSEPGTFECSLDGAPFTPCSSPSTQKVKAGRRKPKQHTFQVRAIDAAGNPDASPAADDFKAKRKKKKK